MEGQKIQQRLEQFKSTAKSAGVKLTHQRLEKSQGEEQTISEKGKRTTTIGCPLADNQSVTTARHRGPTPMLEDHCSHDWRKR